MRSGVPPHRSDVEGADNWTYTGRGKAKSEAKRPNVFDDDDELVPATALNVERYGDDAAVWYDAVVQKVTPKFVEVFYPEDDVTKRHNLLVSGITRKSPKPNGNYMAKGLRWKIKK